MKVSISGCAYPVENGIKIIDPNIIADICNDPDLGVISDAAVASKHGVSDGYVRKLRKKCGKPAYDGWQRNGRSRHPMSSIILNDPELGQVSDVYLAFKHGVKRHLVNSLRRKKGLPPFEPPDRLPNERYERVPIWSKGVFERWINLRPAGIDRQLELLNERSTP